MYCCVSTCISKLHNTTDILQLNPLTNFKVFLTTLLKSGRCASTTPLKKWSASAVAVKVTRSEMLSRFCCSQVNDIHDLHFREKIIRKVLQIQTNSINRVIKNCQKSYLIACSRLSVAGDDRKSARGGWGDGISDVTAPRSSPARLSDRPH